MPSLFYAFLHLTALLKFRMQPTWETFDNKGSFDNGVALKYLTEEGITFYLFIVRVHLRVLASYSTLSTNVILFKNTQKDNKPMVSLQQAVLEQNLPFVLQTSAINLYF